MHPVSVKTVGPDERATWGPLWQGYLRFYETSQASEATEVLWQRLQDPKEPMHVLGAYRDGRLIGII